MIGRPPRGTAATLLSSSPFRRGDFQSPLFLKKVQPATSSSTSTICSTSIRKKPPGLSAFQSSIVRSLGATETKSEWGTGSARPSVKWRVKGLEGQASISSCNAAVVIVRNLGRWSMESSQRSSRSGDFRSNRTEIGQMTDKPTALPDLGIARRHDGDLGEPSQSRGR